MNERIKELWERACTRYSVYETLKPQDERKIIPDIFAELIVNECADILMKPEYAMNHPEELSQYNKGWVYGRLLGIEQIKEHFGVTEE